GRWQPTESTEMHVMQHIRDQSHNHAITRNRQRKTKIKNTKALESIESNGTKRRKMLLKYIGGLQTLHNARIDEIAKVPTISY
ncbi:excinuclease ABC subunit C, partial [Morganella morganii]|nr:excinuclease ABC subunit C [Morganella morganii]